MKFAIMWAKYRVGLR